MKSCCPFLLVFGILQLLSAAKAQTGGSVYGIQLQGVNNNPRLCQLNLDQNTSTVISLQSIGSWVLGPAQAAIDPKRGWYFTSDGLHLYTIDIQTGLTLYDPIVWDMTSPLDSVFESFYYCNSDTSLYCMMWKKQGSQQLVKVNFRNREVTPIVTLPFISVSFAMGMAMAMDEAEQHFFIEAISDDGSNRLLKINRVTGEIENSFVLGNDGSGYFLQFNCNTGKLLAMKAAILPDNRGALTLLEIDPETGAITTLIDFIDNFCYTIPLLNHESNYLYFYAGNNAPAGVITLYKIDLTNNEVVSSQQASGMFPYSMQYLPDSIAIADFSFQEACAMSPVSFTNSSIGAENHWNFDDPVSGVLNESDERNPSHIFSSPGIYDVQLIVWNCYGTDTLTQSITINGFPFQVSLGIDTTFCNDVSLDLQANYPGYDVQWSNGLSGSMLHVSSPGTYSVTVSNSTCSMTDTIHIYQTNCACLATVLPTLTNSTVTIHLNCDYDNYSDFNADFYDEVGRRIFQFPIHSQESWVNISSWAAGIYFYAISDYNHRLVERGKVVLSR